MDHTVDGKALGTKNTDFDPTDHRSYSSSVTSQLGVLYLGEVEKFPQGHITN